MWESSSPTNLCHPSVFSWLQQHKALKLTFGPFHLDCTDTVIRAASWSPSRSNWSLFKATALVSESNSTEQLHPYKTEVYLHLRLIITNLRSPLNNSIDLGIVCQVLAVHNLVEVRCCGGFRVSFRFLGGASKSPFHGSLEALAIRCVLRYGIEGLMKV
jgi:hypothetical protein